MKPPFVVLEGLDGSGKSTIARALAQRMGWRFLTTPGEDLRTIRDEVVRALSASPAARQAFYLATVEEASEEIRALRRSGRGVVLDRYLLSTMVYAEQRGGSLRWRELEHRLLAPDLTVFLDLPLAVRRARLAQRGSTDADVESLHAAFDAGVRAGYRRWGRHRVAGRFLPLMLEGHEEVDDIVARIIREIGATAATRPAVRPAAIRQPSRGANGPPG